MSNSIFEEDNDQLLMETMATPVRSGFIKVNDFCLANPYKDWAGKIENLEVRDDDVWICSFPKTGTTWTLEMAWCIGNDLDLETARKICSRDRVHFLEFATLFDYSKVLALTPEFKDIMTERKTDSVNYADKLPSPRFFKTHLPFDLLPRQIRTSERKPRLVYVMRNPKDACISYYHHASNGANFTGDFQQFCELFLSGRPMYGPFWKHILSYWSRKDLENLLIITYEDMKKDLSSVIRTTADFLGKRLTEEEVDTLKDHLSFESMRANRAVNYENFSYVMQKMKESRKVSKFLRCGQVGQWKDRMSPETIEKFDQLTKKYFKDTGLPYSTQINKSHI